MADQIDLRGHRTYNRSANPRNGGRDGKEAQTWLRHLSPRNFACSPVSGRCSSTHQKAIWKCWESCLKALGCASSRKASSTLQVFCESLAELEEPSGQPVFHSYHSSPIGLIEVGGTSEAVTSLHFVEQRRGARDSAPILGEALKQLEAYFSGALQVFSVPIALQGTAFQQCVWAELQKIPYGHTASYLDIAEALGKRSAVRAVGAANGQNPISIIVPCHRVIGSNGDLVGYGGGLWRKEWLLKHEGALLL